MFVKFSEEKHQCFQFEIYLLKARKQKETYILPLEKCLYTLEEMLIGTVGT